jgi:transmembrane sensor
VGNIYELHGKDRRSVEASTWIAKVDRGLTRAETDEMRRWMAEDPRNHSQLMSLAELWDRMDAMARLSEPFPRSTEERPRKRKGWVAAAGVAIVALLAGLGSTYLLPDAVNGVSERTVATERSAYETAIGGISKVNLSDGSLLVLNTNSQVSVEYSSASRLIYLERGEMHIDVAHDADRPLSVVVGERVVQAVGTAFTIKIDQNQRVELLVVDGKVRVGVAPRNLVAANEVGTAESMFASEEGDLYTKGQRIVLDDDSESLDTLEPQEIEVQLSWREGNLIFDGESLHEAISEISRYTTVEFVFVDEDLQRIRVAGLFKAGDVTGFLASLRANFNIAYEQVNDNTILLSDLRGDAN